MSSNPAPPKDCYTLSEEEERIIRERLETFERDKQNAEPWDVVRKRIFDNRQHPKPR